MLWVRGFRGPGWGGAVPVSTPQRRTAFSALQTLEAIQGFLGPHFGQKGLLPQGSVPLHVPFLSLS